MGRIPYGGANSRFPRRYPQRALRPPFRLAKFEGDAAFVYALVDKVDGSLLQDAIEPGVLRLPQAAPQDQGGE